MASAIQEKISNRVNQVLWLTESIENLNYTIVELRKKVIALENIEPDNIISSERVETVFEIVKLKGSIRTGQVKHVLKLKHNIQAIRVMKYTARIHSANVYLFQSRKGNREYSLNMKKERQKT